MKPPIPDFNTLRADFLLPGLLSTRTVCGTGTFLFAPPGVMTKDCAISPHNHGYDLDIHVYSGKLHDRLYIVEDGAELYEFSYSGVENPLERLRSVSLRLVGGLENRGGSEYTLPASTIHAPYVHSPEGAVWLRIERNRVHDGDRRLYAAEPVVPTAAREPTAAERRWAIEAFHGGVVSTAKARARRKRSADALWKEAREGETHEQRIEAIGALLRNDYAVITSWECNYPVDSTIRTTSVSLQLECHSEEVTWEDKKSSEKS